MVSKAEWTETGLSLHPLHILSCGEFDFRKQISRYKDGKLLEHQVAVLEYREAI
jgi:hypothetical protein